MKKKRVLVNLLIIMSLVLSACSGNGNGSSPEESEKEIIKHNLRVVVNYNENLFFSKYDVDVMVDSENVGTVSQGDLLDKTVNVEEGSHNITIYNSGDETISSKIKVEVHEDRVVTFSMKAHSDSIDVIDKTDEALDVFEARVEKEKAEREAEEAKKKERAKKEKEKKERLKAEAEQKKEEEEKAKQEAAKMEKERRPFFRAAVVGMTNALAWDVFTTDGSRIDKSKLHNYDYSGECSLSVVDEGVWTKKSDNKWTVFGLYLSNTSGIPLEVEMDVTYTGKAYELSNIKGVFGDPEMIAKYGDNFKTDLSYLNDDYTAKPCLTVSKSLVLGD